jgi:CHAT domain-containing protein
MLSACRTAQGDAALADESIHLAAAFQLAGYRHVIGTLWNLRDTAAPEIAREVYARVANPNASHDDTATALHEAVLQLRQLPGFTGPIAWAPYIHFGP